MLMLLRFLHALWTQSAADLPQSCSVSSLHSVVRHGFTHSTVRMCLRLKSTNRRPRHPSAIWMRECASGASRSLTRPAMRSEFPSCHSSLADQTSVRALSVESCCWHWVIPSFRGDERSIGLTEHAVRADRPTVGVPNLWGSSLDCVPTEVAAQLRTGLLPEHPRWRRSPVPFPIQSVLFVLSRTPLSQMEYFYPTEFFVSSGCVTMAQLLLFHDHLVMFILEPRKDTRGAQNTDGCEPQQKT